MLRIRGLNDRGSIPGTGKSYFYFPKFTKRFRGLNNIISYVCREFFPRLNLPGVYLKFLGFSSITLAAQTQNFTFTFVHSFHWHVQNATVPCRSQELLPFLSVMYFFLPPFSTNYSSILPHFILPSISWFTSQSCCSQIHI